MTRGRRDWPGTTLNETCRSVTAPRELMARNMTWCWPGERPKALKVVAETEDGTVLARLHSARRRPCRLATQCAVDDDVYSGY